MIREARVDDAASIVRIYNHYVLDTAITFEEAAVSTLEMADRIGEVTGRGLPWLVLEEDGEVVGYAYANRWKGRSAYRFSVETTIYIAHDRAGQGRGTRLYETLFACLRARGIHVAIAGVVQPNAASVALHEKLGMTQVACFREVGFKFEQWLDVAYWEKLL